MTMTLDEDIQPITLDDKDISTTIELIFITEKTDKNAKLFPADDLTTLIDSLTKLVSHLNQAVTADNIVLSPLVNDLLIANLPPLRKNVASVTKRKLDSYPPLLQLVLLLQYLGETTPQTVLKKQWVLLGLLIAIRLKHLGLKSYYQTLILRIKLAIFVQKPTYQWIWQVLEDNRLERVIAGEQAQQPQLAIQLFAGLLHKISSDYLEQMRLTNSETAGLKRSKQLHYIAKAFEVSFYKSKRQRAKIEATAQQHEAQQEQFIKEIKELKERNKIKSQSAQVLAKPVYHQPSQTAYTWDKPSVGKDIVTTSPVLQTQYLIPAFTHNANFSHHNQAQSFEEAIENTDKLVSHDERPSPSIAYSPPLQAVELTLQQLYISRRDFRFNTDTRLLSQAGYQQVFNRLVIDSLREPSEDFPVAHKKSASLLLLSLITAMPVKTLLQPHFITTCSLFIMQKKQADLSYRLGITPRKIDQPQLIFENNSDKVTLPLPIELVKYLSKVENLPSLADKSAGKSSNELADYLAVLKDSLELPYLSLSRIETALQAILSRYIKDSHTHIAELICRTPAPDAPAMFYSSHLNKALITHYTKALAWLNTQQSLPLDYFSRKKNDSVGSSFALTIESVTQLLVTLQNWVNASDDLVTHFNRISSYVWLVTCVLTGLRPNNALGSVKDIDLRIGWLLVNDKPNKATKNHRLIPLCDTLIRHLKAYQTLLAKLRLHTLAKPALAQTLHHIGSDKADITLINLLSDNFDKLIAIKRGDMNTLLEPFIALDFYWTRHFARTQLEKEGVAIHLINAVIGHEKTQQEVMGKYSSVSTKQLHNVRHTFENIAVNLRLDDDFLPHTIQQFNQRL